ncbi:MAG: hypothetical protein L3K26_15380 [Candidatus Hydrogenedentes bacterium]|nr:hypothetical protein [Candidatus Hydrogenedentota bacterium]
MNMHHLEQTTERSYLQKVGSKARSLGRKVIVPVAAAAYALMPVPGASAAAVSLDTFNENDTYALQSTEYAGPMAASADITIDDGLSLDDVPLADRTTEITQDFDPSFQYSVELIDIVNVESGLNNFVYLIANNSTGGPDYDGGAFDLGAADVLAHGTSNPFFVGSYNGTTDLYDITSTFGVNLTSGNDFVFSLTSDATELDFQTFNAYTVGAGSSSGQVLAPSSTVVPEPATGAMVALGLGMYAANQARRRRKEDE